MEEQKILDTCRERYNPSHVSTTEPTYRAVAAFSKMSGFSSSLQGQSLGSSWCLAVDAGKNAKSNRIHGFTKRIILSSVINCSSVGSIEISFSANSRSGGAIWVQWQQRLILASRRGLLILIASCPCPAIFFIFFILTALYSICVFLQIQDFENSI